MIGSAIAGIISWIISILPKIVIVFLIFYVMKMIYDYGEKRWREGFSKYNGLGIIKSRELNCI